jgi:addiction module RelE/StbE family toxin
VKVKLSAGAAADIEAAFQHLRQQSPNAAEAVRSAIVKAVNSLSAMPSRGRPGRVAGTRELVVRAAPYVVVYHVTGEAVQVFRVRHTSQAR